MLKDQQKFNFCINETLKRKGKNDGGKIKNSPKPYIYLSEVLYSICYFSTQFSNQFFPSYTSHFLKLFFSVGIKYLHSTIAQNDVILFNLHSITIFSSYVLMFSSILVFFYLKFRFVC